MNSVASLGLILFCSILTLFHTSDPAKAQSWDDLVDSVIKDHNTEVLRLRKEKAKSSDIHALAEKRNEKLRQLTLQMEAATDDRSLTKALSLAHCFEYLNQPSDCIVNCLRAHQIDPENEAHYFPWIRTTLNQGQIKKAIGILNEAVKRLGPESKIHGFHGQLYFYYFKHSEYQKASNHGSAICEYYFHLLKSERQGAAQALAAFLPTFEEVSLLADSPEAIQTTADSIRQHLETYLAKETAEDDFWFHKLRCEANRIANPSHFETTLIEWIRFAQNRLNNRTEYALAMRDFLETLKYTSDHAFAIDAPEPILVTLRTVRENLKQQSTKPPLIAAITMLIKAIEIRQNHLRIIGKKLPNLDIERLEDYTLVSEPNPQMIYFWAPFGAKPFEGFEFVDDERRYDRWGNFNLTAVAPYSGFQWQDEQSAPVINPSLPNAQEKKMFTDFVQSRNLSGSHAMTPSDSTTAQYFSLEFYPLTVIVDNHGVIRTVVIGFSQATKRHLRVLTHQVNLIDSQPTNGYVAGD